MRYFIALVASCTLGMLITSSVGRAQTVGALEQACGRWAEDPDPAIDACTEVIRRYCQVHDNCSEDYRKAGLARYFVFRGDAFAHLKGAYKRAIVDFNEAISMVSNEFPNVLNPAYVGRAFAYISLGQHDQAIASIDEYFSKINPPKGSSFDGPFGSEYMLLGVRGIAYSRKGDYERAIADLTMAIKLNSRDPLPYTERGTAYTGKAWHDRALADHDAAIRINSSEPIAYVRRGQTFEARGEREMAIEDYNKALALRAKFQWQRHEQAVARKRRDALK